MGILKAAILDSARRHRKLRDDQLSGKFEKISPPKQPSTDGVLVHNLSSHRFTQQQLTILSYDAKFSTRDARPKDFIASFESALQKCEAGEECKNAMRQQVSTLLLQHKRQMTISKAEDRELLKIRKLEDIVTLPADKGRSTVVMDKAEYCTKLGNLLMDKEAYAPSTVSEFKRLVNSINKTIGKLRKAGALTRREALAAKASDAAMARFYGLPKVHKPGVPLRPIVSLRGTPTFGLSKWLYQRLCFLTKDSEWTVKSAEEFLSRIKRLEVEADEVMVSFDVISLFTSIPPALAIDTIDGFLREKYDETDQQLKRVHIIQLLELCLKTFFTFNGQVYEQKKGTPMGSPLSGLIAEAVLQRLERLVFSSYPPKFWARYVDDTFVIIKRSDVQTFKTLLNSIFPDIQFTMEEELNNTLAFLDVQVTKLEDGKIRTTVYRKATNTRRILHFKSNHPVGHKRSCVRTLFQRVQTHCSDDNGRKEEIKYLHALFKANGYPKSFIRKCLKKPHPERSDGEKPKFWLAIPYVKNVSEATARILKPFGIGVAHKPESTIRQQIMRPKDPLPVTEQSAVVYSIPCQNCDARYVGETGKRLGTRLHEHQLAINRKDKLSMVYGHVKQQNHNFAFEKARVIGRANDKMARLMLESWSSTGTLNRAIDLHPAYQALRTRLESVRTRPSGQSSRVTRGRQPMPAESRREAGRGSCEQHGTPPHRHAHEAEINSHEPQQLISPLGDEGEADKHAGSPTITTVAKGSLVAGAHRRSIVERSALIGGERAGQTAREKLTGSATLTFTRNGQSHCLKALLPRPSSNASALSSAPLHRQAAKTQIIELVDQHSGLVGQPESDDTATKLQRQIISLSVAANVSSPFTSFIAVDPDRLVAPKRPAPRMMYDCVDLCASACAFTSQSVAVAHACCEESAVPAAAYRMSAAPLWMAVESMPMEEMATDAEEDTACSCGPASSASAAVATAAEDVVASIAALQEFVGCWPLSAELSRLLNCSLEALQATTPPNFSGEDGRIWATALVLAFLKLKAARRSTEWILLAKKGRSWLAKHLSATTPAGDEKGGDSSLDGLLSLAKTTLTSLLLPSP
ncbi:hypothetical protein SprV_0602235700 [Sparganum proliferum]